MSAHLDGEQRRHPRANVIASAAVLREGHHLGTYVVRNLSADGALLVGATDVEAGADLQLLLQVGRRSLHLRARVARSTNIGGGYGLAVVFAWVRPAVQDWLQEIVLAGVERQCVEAKDGRPSVLIVDNELPTARALARELDRLGLRSLLAVTPFDPLSQVGGSERNVVAVVADLHIGWTSGLDLLSFFAVAHPQMRRVLVSADLRACKTQLEIPDSPCQAVVERPWTRQSIERGLALPSPTVRSRPARPGLRSLRFETGSSDATMHIRFAP